MTYSVQKKAGVELNRLYEADLPVHDWYRFVLSFPPHVVRYYLDKFNITSKERVLDPFCGTGTTLVECKKRNIAAIGIEANPIAHLAAKTKTNLLINTRDFQRHAAQVAMQAGKKISRSRKYRQLPEEAEKLIIKHSISPRPLHKCLILAETLNEFYAEEFINHEQIAFAKLIVHAFSNLYFGPEVGVAKMKKEDAPVIELWLEQIHKMAVDMDQFNQRIKSKTDVHLGDAREIKPLIRANSIHAVITSPPYPNEKDYTRITRLESVILGYIKNRVDLRMYKNNLLRSNTRNIYKNDDDDQWIYQIKEINQLADAIEDRRIKLNKTSGFEKQYHKVVRHYFGGMAKHLDELRFKLRRGAHLAYVVGDQASYFRIHIKTGKLLSLVAKHLGYEVLAIDLFRTRLSTTTKQQLREEVVILKWKG